MEITKIITNEDGLHARPAGVLAKTASNFASQINILFNGRSVNAKSAMMIMTLGLAKNNEIRIQAEGSDAELALAKMSELIDGQFQVRG